MGGVNTYGVGVCWAAGRVERFGVLGGAHLLPRAVCPVPHSYLLYAYGLGLPVLNLISIQLYTLHVQYNV